MAQNIYDDPTFFAGYSDFPRSRLGLAGTSEWPAMRRLLPDVAGRRVLDLGCGFGQFARWAADNGACSVHGIDLSERMLARGKELTSSPVVTYERADLETVALPAGSFDLIFSSMAFHYVEDFDRLCGALATGLAPGGALVFSVEHPIFAARAQPEWVTAADGRKAWAIVDYGCEGRRVTNWITEGVVKYHRTIGTMFAALTAAGFALSAIEEWRPDAAQLADHPDWRDELVRPTFLLIAARLAGPAASG